MSLKMPPEWRMYSSGGAPGSRLVTTSISGVPISPASRRAFTAANVGSKRRWKPIMHVTPAFFTAAAHSFARARSRSTGFSQKIALPAAAARTMKSACVSVDEPMTTAAIARSANTSSALATRALWSVASDCAASALTSDTAARRTPGWRARLPAWIRPMRPAPSKATSIMGFSPSGMRRRRCQREGLQNAPRRDADALAGQRHREAIERERRRHARADLARERRLGVGVERAVGERQVRKRRQPVVAAKRRRRAADQRREPVEAVEREVERAVVVRRLLDAAHRDVLRGQRRGECRGGRRDVLEAPAQVALHRHVRREAARSKARREGVDHVDEPVLRHGLGKEPQRVHRLGAGYGSVGVGSVDHSSRTRKSWTPGAAARIALPRSSASPAKKSLQVPPAASTIAMPAATSQALMCGSK